MCSQYKLSCVTCSINYKFKLVRVRKNFCDETELVKALNSTLKTNFFRMLHTN